MKAGKVGRASSSDILIGHRFGDGKMVMNCHQSEPSAFTNIHLPIRFHEILLKLESAVCTGGGETKRGG